MSDYEHPDNEHPEQRGHCDTELLDFMRANGCPARKWCQHDESFFWYWPNNNDAESFPSLDEAIRAAIAQKEQPK